jgi:hypothetical protein
MRTAALLILFSLVSFVSSADEVKNVEWGTEMWPGLTDRDGTGLYTHIFTEVFTSQGVALTPTYLPFKQTIDLVDNHKLDFAGGVLKDKVESEKHIQARFPVLSTRVNAFFRKTTVKGEWQGVHTIQGHKIVASPQLGEAIGLNKDEFREVPTKVQAFKMVVMGQADFYIDDVGEMELTIKQNKDGVAPYNESDFDIQPVGKTDWYMISPNNSRGRQVMEIYEKGTLHLYRSGKLKNLYENRGFHVPIQVLDLSQK